MSNLRQRASQNSMDSEEKPSLDQKLATGATPVVSTPSPPRDRRGALTIFVSLACALLLYTQKRSHSDLPQSYALCSRTGQDIYTVDTAGAKVQCIAVQDAQIVATGSLGAHSIPTASCDAFLLEPICLQTRSRKIGATSLYGISARGPSSSLA